MKDDVSKERTRNYFQQIKGAVAYKVAAMLASFLAIPLMISYLGQERFGVWSTLLAVMSWLVFFDLGVGNGLRNRVAEALARNDKRDAENFIASGYSLIGLIALILWILVTGSAFFVSWQAVFNTESISEPVLRLTVQITVFFVILNIWIGLIHAVLGAFQKTAMTALAQLVSNFLALVLVYLLKKTTDASIILLAVVYGVSLVIASIGLSIWFFQSHSELRPKIYFEKAHFKPLLSVGLQFFIIQIAVLIIFATDKILITQMLGPEYVVQYDVVYKLFSLITFAHTLISTPLWSAYTDAYQRNDLIWIQQTLRMQLIIFGGVLVATFVMALLSKEIVALWIGPDVVVAKQLIVAIGIFVLVSTWNNIFAMFVNGIGRIKVQLYTAVIAMIMNIPLAIYFVKSLDLGVSGVVLATAVSLLLAAIALPIQVGQVIRSNANPERSV